MFTLTLVFNKECNKVLMCIHKKQGMLNYIGGKVEAFEEPMDASYRELEEETGYYADINDVTFLLSLYTTVAFCNEKMARMMFSMFSFSLYVGMITMLSLCVMLCYICQSSIFNLQRTCAAKV